MSMQVRPQYSYAIRIQLAVIEKHLPKSYVDDFAVYRNSGFVGIGVFNAFFGLYSHTYFVVCCHHFRHFYGRTGGAQTNVEDEQ